MFLRRYSTVPIRLVFYTKQNCMLCREAKQVLDGALKKSATPISLEMVDIEAPSNEASFEKYRYDIPVMKVQRDGFKDIVYMHRFEESELVDEFNEEL